MIQIERLRVKEFRGIREIELDLGGKSFIIHGPNGSGKSGIVDAIDFALTGNVRRLSGEGTGTVSIANHAPHVLARSTPSERVLFAPGSRPMLDCHPSRSTRSVVPSQARGSGFTRDLSTPTRRDLSLG